MNIGEYIEDSLISLNLSGHTKEEVLAELVGILAKAGKIEDPNSLVEIIQEREGLGSTGIGHGVAIPHGRYKELEKTTIAFGRSVKDVEFDSIDGKPARLFFLLVAPENGGNEHLFTLAKIARLMKDAHTRDKLLSLETSAEVLDLLVKRDL